MSDSLLSNVRYPSVPLIVHDPYFSIWSAHDHLNDGWESHWTGSGVGLCGLLRVDGSCCTFAGEPGVAPAIPQTGVEVLPTRTVYRFENELVKLAVTFLTPALPHRPDILSRPVTYIIFEVESADGRPHRAQVYFDMGGESCVDQPGDSVVWSRYRHGDFELMSFASAVQNPLTRSGDNLRIDWGRSYLGVPKKFNACTAMRPNRELRGAFAASGTIPEDDLLDMPRAVRQGWVSAAVAIELEVAAQGAASAWIVAGYDDVWAIEYLHRKLAAYWKSFFRDFGGLLTAVYAEYETLKSECEAYDAELTADAVKVGGERYAVLLGGAFRQAIAAHKLVADLDGTLLFFSKENFSNGCIATVDVTYPSAPLFLLTQPALLKGMLIPILEYAGTSRWKFPFAPHDIGTYPLANGQVYGGGEETEEDQMPVEECGNMLILAGALLKFSGDKAFIDRYLSTWKKWAYYLLDKGYDPENQLCTDDFAGHLAHNTNLSLKAILALECYALIARENGEAAEAGKFHRAAQDAANRWCVDALDGDHYRLAFDQPGTWSQKYNLIWDRLLGFGLFPEEVAKRELAFYRTKQERYGLPLDNRRTYTKLDWIVWSATLTGDDADFRALVDPLYDWLNETPSRVPMNDWYEATDGRQVCFQARSVVGGLFIKLLADPGVRAKYLAKLKIHS